MFHYFCSCTHFLLYFHYFSRLLPQPHLILCTPALAEFSIWIFMISNITCLYFVPCFLIWPQAVPCLPSSLSLYFPSSTSHTRCSPASLSLPGNQFRSSLSQTQLLRLDTSSHPSHPFYSSAIQCHTLSSLLPRGETGLKHSISLGHTCSLALCTNLTPHPHGQPALGSLAPCAGMSPVHPQSHQPFGPSGRASPAPWLRWIGGRCSKQSCSCIEARAVCWVWVSWFFFFFLAGTYN